MEATETTLAASVRLTISRLSRTRRVDGAGFITVVAFLLFLAGIVLCYFGVSNLVEGSA